MDAGTNTRDANRPADVDIFDDCDISDFLRELSQEFAENILVDNESDAKIGAYDVDNALEDVLFP